MSRLWVELAGVALRSPLVGCSGCCGFGIELKRMGALEGLGALFLKGVTVKPRHGNPPPRLWETACGVINSIGLENPGLEKVVLEVLPQLDLGIPVFCNISGYTVDEFSELAAAFQRTSADGIEVNVSCPNIEQGGKVFGASPEWVYRATRAVRLATSKPVLVKLSIACADIAEVALAAKEAGADGLSLINTVPAMALDPVSLKPALGNVSGGLSGPAIKPISLLAVWKAYEATGLPIVGMGGVREAQDVLEFMAAGATAVGLGLQLLIDPFSPRKIARELWESLERRGFQNAREIVGYAHGSTGGSS
ncbi:MAG: dihydroorotate dehydrogenase [Bacillota bacterium]